MGTRLHVSITLSKEASEYLDKMPNKSRYIDHLLRREAEAFEPNILGDRMEQLDAINKQIHDKEGQLSGLYANTTAATTAQVAKETRYHATMMDRIALSIKITEPLLDGAFRTGNQNEILIQRQLAQKQAKLSVIKEQISIKTAAIEAEYAIKEDKARQSLHDGITRLEAERTAIIKAIKQSREREGAKDGQV